MPKVKVTADQLISELNAAYEKQDRYDPENRFRAFPEGAMGRNITGYTTPGRWTLEHAEAWNQVNDQFELDVEGGA